jgi:hypothetical protein
MTSAQSRALRQIAEREASLRQSKDELLDVLLAILAASGGSVKVPMGVVESTFRQEVILEYTADDLIVSTATAAEKRGPARMRVARRVLGSLFSGN